MNKKNLTALKEKQRDLFDLLCITRRVLLYSKIVSTKNRSLFQKCMSMPLFNNDLLYMYIYKIMIIVHIMHLLN